MDDDESGRVKKKVLFVAEAVTLAHMARPMVLAGSLNQERYDITLAADARYDFLFPETRMRRLPLDSISSSQFMQALAKGAPVYDDKTLKSYVDEDLRLIDQVRPDLIVGDFRLSLSVSARLMKVPYATVTNAYWSPYAEQAYPVPELPVVKLLGVGLGQRMFNLVRPLAFRLHARPLNNVRRYFGLPSLEADLRRVYTDADQTLYADIPGLVSTAPMPATHRFLGPVIWSPDCGLPAWWGDLDATCPVVYVTPGSSGNSAILPTIIEALATLPVQVIVAATRGIEGSILPPNVHVADYLPGASAAAIASLVICNGGSPTAYQALTNGCPVIGIPSNLDQYLNMTSLEKHGLGLLLRSDRLSVGQLQAAVHQLLSDRTYSQNVGRMQAVFSEWQADRVFPAIIDEWM